jgi:hypothetical protein
VDAIPAVHWDLLTDYIAQERCVPILGAAANVSSSARGYEGLPLAADVARAMKAEMGLDDQDTRDLDLDLDLAKVALEVQFQTDRPHLIEFLKHVLPDREREPSPLLRTLARLPFRLIVTTNYDRLMERALDEAGRPFIAVCQPIRPGPTIQRLLRDTLARSTDLVLYKMHGTFSDGEDEELTLTDLIITEDDYIDFLSAINAGGIPALILSKMVDSTGLILGYSVKDWDFRMIYRGLPRNQMRRAVAVLKEDPSRFWSRYLSHMGFHVFAMDVYDFAEELGRRWESTRLRPAT